jgi:hypothetical protein
MRDSHYIARKLLGEKNGVSETDHEGQIIFAGNDFPQEACSCSELEREPVCNRRARVDHKSDAQGKLGFIAKFGDRYRRHLIITDTHLLGRKVPHGFSMIHGCEEYGDFIHVLPESPTGVSASQAPFDRTRSGGNVGEYLP